jgi:hypothetical protein
MLALSIGDHPGIDGAQAARLLGFFRLIDEGHAWLLTSTTPSNKHVIHLAALRVIL